MGSWSDSASPRRGANVRSTGAQGQAAAAQPTPPDTLAWRGYFSHAPYDVAPYSTTAATWDDLDAALGASPQTLADWTARRGAVVDAVKSMLGDLPPRPVAPSAAIQSDVQMNGYRLLHFTIDNGVGQTIPGNLFIPDVPGPKPLIHYMHYDGGEYGMGKHEVGNPTWPLQESEGVHLAQHGYVVLVIDAYAFGERQHQVTDDPSLGGLDERDNWERHFRSQGRGASLWGMMMRDDQIALDWATTLADVDTSRIVAMGMSMGSKRAFWMAAIDDRIKVVISVAGLPGFQRGAAALVAPRPFLHLVGDQDEYTPAADTVAVNATLGALYDVYGKREQHRSVVYPGLDHDFTLSMWAESLTWLATWMPATPPSTMTPSCWGLEDGLYCGGDQVLGLPDRLYRCSGAKPHKNGAISIVQDCDSGCRTNGAAADDACN